jgi:hypothetical protein
MKRILQKKIRNVRHHRKHQKRRLASVTQYHKNNHGQNDGTQRRDVYVSKETHKFHHRREHISIFSLNECRDTRIKR